MPSVGLRSTGIPRLKSWSEDGDGDGTGDCKQVESATSIAVGSEIFLEGLKHVVKASIWAAARSMFIITACLMLQGDTNYHSKCGPKLNACIANPWKNGVRLDCRSCYDHCVNNRGKWNCPVYE